MTVLSSFEILAENLVPEGILPPGTENPFLVQGFFVQISLSTESSASSVQFNLVFEETTDFKQGAGQSALQAQIIDDTGEVQIYDQFFASVGRGFLNQTVNRGKTMIYGVQVFAAKAAEALPQSGTGWRGTVQVNDYPTQSLIATPTQRLVYYESAPFSTPVIDASVYPVPTASGGTLI